MCNLFVHLTQKINTDNKKTDPPQKKNNFRNNSVQNVRRFLLDLPEHNL